ncbi:MAG: hypothetical protein VZR22_08870, partial [Candidatus Cryptobacteroides sp.]|nr:hypothetical protein [Candidatus Cryptobacteroides sp.]
FGAMLYLSGDKPSSALEWQEARIAIEGLKLENPVLVEPVTGRIFSLDRYHYSPNNPTRTYSLPVWDSPVFLLDRSAVISTSSNTEWHHEW